jgi:hypothetical protein
MAVNEATMKSAADGARVTAPRWLSLGVFAVCAIVIAASWVAMAHHPRWRARIDSTKTRAYSLSDQTARILSRLEGDWSISVVCVESGLEPSIVRQIDEVLDRYDESSDALVVERIDPVVERDVARYQQLIERLRMTFSEEVGKWEHALDTGRSAFDSATAAIGAQATATRSMGATLPADHRLRPAIQAASNAMTLLLDAVDPIEQAIDTALATGEARPIPDYETARSTLAAALRERANFAAGASTDWERHMRVEGLPADLRAALARGRVEFERLAGAAQRAADDLAALPPLELVRIGAELAHGEAAVVIGPGRAAVIPAWQLFPRGNLRSTGEGVTFDQRFRGEQLLSSTVQSLLVERMPMIVFVHAGSESMLARRGNAVDFFGASTILRAARYDVREWRTSVEREPPRPEAGQQAVWIICPPPLVERMSRSAFDVSPEERGLIERSRELIDRGESVLITFFPSAMHAFRQADPWQELLAGFGVRPDTSSIIFEESLDAEGQPVKSDAVTVIDPGAEHAISRAVAGQGFLASLPVVIGSTSSGAGAQREVLMHVAADPARWIEPDWTQGPSRLDEPTQEQRLSHPAPIAVAATRRHAERQREQRVVAVGSGNWLYSAIADRIVSVGGDRVALLHPGNIEFLQASVAWLAGLDDMIAQSPTSRQIARLEGLDDGVRSRWRWALVAGLPLLSLLTGAAVWLKRRT